ncbi:thioesterase II family protein [Actinosynnema sp. NPDC059797]
MIPNATGHRKSLLDGRFRTATARYGLYCFPAAGAVPFCSGWEDRFRGAVELVPVGAHGSPGTVHSTDTASSEAADEVAVDISAARTRPMLFGHGAGALLALEVARRLEELGAPATHLFVGGQPAPPRGRTRPPVNPLPRAGVTTIGAYRRPAPPLSCPVFAWCGSHDPAVGPSALQGWAAETAAGLKLFVRPGGPAFLARHADEVVRVVHDEASRLDATSPTTTDPARS